MNCELAESLIHLVSETHYANYEWIMRNANGKAFTFTEFETCRKSVVTGLMHLGYESSASHKNHVIMVNAWRA